ncbi:MAG TPA: hypothetical protein VJ828_02615 [Lacipirellulaceae bacterium]|nr:hypothetical protein [Lacipirellulaceae bacterium]
MAGNKRFAAIIFICLIAICATGAGAYYLLVHSGWTLALEHEGAAAQAESQVAAPSELDAVARALAQATDEQHFDANVKSSEQAHAEGIDPTRQEEPAPYSPPVVDRYALAPIASEPVPVSPAAAEESGELYAVNAQSNDRTQQSASSQSQLPQQLPADNAAGYVEAITEPTQQSSEATYDSLPVARGQEPSDDAAAALEVADEAAEPMPPAGELGSVRGDIQPRVPLAVSAEEPNLNTAAQRARNAFRDETAPIPADRYGAATSPRTSISAAASGNPPANPFEAKNRRASQLAAGDGLIEAIPELPANGEAQLPNNQQNDATYEAPAANADVAPPAAFGASQPRSISTLPNDDIGSQANASGGGFIDNGESGASDLGGTGRPGERALEGPQKPALLVQKFAPAEIQVGKPAKFVVQIRNVGVQAADEVVIRDEVPQGTRLISTSPSAQANGNELVWQLGKLSAGEERSLEMQLMPVTEGEIGSVARVSYSAQASVKTRCTMPQLAIRMTAPDKVMIGQEQRVKIELRNPGSGDATGVMLFENVPENVKHAAGPALEFEIGTLRPGETRELELVLLAEKAGKVINVLTAKAEGNLQVQQQVEFEVIAPALEVAVSGPERRYLERPATYEVSVENPGTAPAHDVQIITKLPKGMRFVRANNMGEYDASTHAVYWSLAELPEGESGKVELVTMPVETGPQTLEVESRAGQGLADQAKQQILVEGLAAIMFELRDVEDPIEVGGETGYEIRVVNQGTKAAANVQVAVHLPPGMQVVSAEGETQHSTRGGALMFEALPQLLPKADTLFRVRVQGLQAGDQRITVEVNTDDLAQPIRREESTRVFGDE